MRKSLAPVSGSALNARSSLAPRQSLAPGKQSLGNTRTAVGGRSSSIGGRQSLAPIGRSILKALGATGHIFVGLW